MARGGARPGAGRKKKDTKVLQIANREVVLAQVDAAALRLMVDGIVAEAANGNAKAFAAIAPYLLGSPGQEIQVTGAGGGPLKVKVIYDDPEPSAPEAT
jgi:hypothetical protein